MNRNVWKWTAAAAAGALGLGMMALQNSILRDGFDEAGLLIVTNPGLWVLWAATVVYLAGAAALAFYLGEGGSFEEDFPACPYSGLTTVVAGLLMFFTGFRGLSEGNLLSICALVISVGMVMGGICRCCGWKPDWWMDMIIFLGYTVVLVWSYRAWNVEPNLQTYGFPLLSLIAAMMFALHRARCPWGYPDRRRMIFFGLAGMYLSFPAIPGEAEAGFFFATAVWCAGALCELKKQRPVIPEAPEEASAPEAEEIPEIPAADEGEI